jgi:hypothetical protein
VARRYPKSRFEEMDDTLSGYFAAGRLRQPSHNNRSNKDDHRGAENVDASTLVRFDAARTALRR